MLVTLTAPSTSSDPAPSPAPAGPALTTSMECMTDGSSPERKKRRVGEDEVNEARAETITGLSWSSDTLNAPESGVVRPVRPTAEPGGYTRLVHRRGRVGRGRERDGRPTGKGEEKKVGGGRDRRAEEGHIWTSSARVARSSKHDGRGSPPRTWEPQNTKRRLRRHHGPPELCTPFVCAETTPPSCPSNV